MSKTQLYRWYDKDDNLLYVGISYSAMVRASQHKAKSNDGWYDLAVKSTTENFDSRDAALKAESNAIKRSVKMSLMFICSNTYLK